MGLHRKPRLLSISARNTRRQKETLPCPATLALHASHWHYGTFLPHLTRAARAQSPVWYTGVGGCSHNHGHRAVTGDNLVVAFAWRPVASTIAPLLPYKVPSTKPGGGLTPPPRLPCAPAGLRAFHLCARTIWHATCHSRSWRHDLSAHLAPVCPSAMGRVHYAFCASRHLCVSGVRSRVVLKAI